jgi:hypothetical protein
MKVYAGYDVKSEKFMPPFFSINLKTALRSIEVACSDPASHYNKFPGDFQFFDLGEWDEDTGCFDCEFKPRLIATPSDFIKAPPGAAEPAKQA